MAYKDPHDPRYKEARRKHYHANKAQYAARNRAKQLALMEYIRLAKDKPCVDCAGEFHYSAMDFDHREGEVKVKNLAALHGYSLRIVQEEIKKCDLVCANCHRYRTFMRMSNGYATDSKPERGGFDSYHSRHGPIA